MEMENFWRELAKKTPDPLDLGQYRLAIEECATLATEPTDVTYEEVKCPGTVRPAIWCRPNLSAPTKVILYFHGGGYTAGSPSSHRKLAAHLAKHAGTYALVLDYRRAPEDPFPAQIEDAVAAYKWLKDTQGYQPDGIAFAGDSAGGNLSVATSLAILKEGLPVPAAIAAFSPWLDMRVSGESYDRNAGKDALAVKEHLPSVISTYVGSASLADPLIDLLRVDLMGMPPMYITVGTSELLEDDSRTLAANARKAGIDVQLDVEKDLQHIWIALAGNAPEADKSLMAAAKFIKSKMSDL